MNASGFSQKDNDHTALFTAPEAKVLIVDDNRVSQTMVKGLLNPLQMNIETASSGREAVDKVEENHFDLIFMDHRMPEMSGMEATRLIRLGENGKKIPVIALSADTSEGIRETFLNAGMNDYIAKPVEAKIITSKVRQWLPPEKVRNAYTVIDKEKQEDTPDLIGDLDVRMALRLFGSMKIYFVVLEAFYKSIERKAELIRWTVSQKNWERYAIEVHALRGISEQIGARLLGDMAGELESAGNSGNIAFIEKHTPMLVEKYLSYISVLEPFFKKKKTLKAKKKITSEILEECFQKMREAIDDLNILQLESIMADLKKYRYEEEEQELFDFLEESVEDMDTEACMALIEEWEVCL